MEHFFFFFIKRQPPLFFFISNTQQHAAIEWCEMRLLNNDKKYKNFKFFYFFDAFFNFYSSFLSYYIPNSNCFKEQFDGFDKFKLWLYMNNSNQIYILYIFLTIFYNYNFFRSLSDRQSQKKKIMLKNCFEIVYFVIVWLNLLQNVYCFFLHN